MQRSRERRDFAPSEEMAGARAPRVLVVDDESEACQLAQYILGRAGASVKALMQPERALDLIVEDDFDVVLTDLNMPALDGIMLCERVRAARPDIPVIVFSGEGTLQAAMEAMRVGAFDFVTKPLVPAVVSTAVHRAAAARELQRELVRLRAETAEPVEGFLGASGAIRRTLALVDRAARSEASILLQGATGTGKEILARRIHALSGRRDGPFVAVNCAAVSPALLESELFGHVRGAFTDANTPRRGLFVAADRGTIFLDEIGELPLELQPKILRAVQERAVRPVGSDDEIGFDARFVAATNRALEDEVLERRFREDLYYRLGVVRVDVPSLRERDGDVVLLAEHFLARYAQGRARILSRAALDKLIAYDWPGNVRELENVIESSLALSPDDLIDVDVLPRKILDYVDVAVAEIDDPASLVTMEELSRRYAARVVSLVGGNMSRAARLLGIDRRTLHKRLVDWGILG